MLIEISANGDRSIAIRPAGYLGKDAFPKYLAAVKSGGGRSIKDSSGRWQQVAAIESLVDVCHALQREGFQLHIDPSLLCHLESIHRESSAAAQEAAARTSRMESSLAERGLQLYPYQRVGVSWLAQMQSALLCDEMGLGKTVQALLAAPEGAPVLVVCPANAKWVWADHAASPTRRNPRGKGWRPDLRVSVLSGRGSFRWPRCGEMVITNYDILPETAPAPADGTVLIVDECHSAKNPRSIRTARLQALIGAVLEHNGKAWGLTGTPLLNRPAELLTLLHVFRLLKRTFGNWRRGAYLLGGYQGRYGWEWSNSIDESVPGILERVMLRRRKAEVLADLPEKRREFIPVELSSDLNSRLSAILEKWESEAGMDLDDIVSRLRGEDDWEGSRVRIPFEELSGVRHQIARAMVPVMHSIIDEHEEQGQPIVVASCHREPIEECGERSGWGAIIGGMDPEARRQIESRFQNGELRGVGLTIRAGGVAITLTRASTMLFVDLDWTPSLNIQCEDRIHRIGQDRGCIYYILVPQHPLTERLAELLRYKMDLIDATVERVAERQVASISTVADKAGAVLQHLSGNNDSASSPQTIPVEIDLRAYGGQVIEFRRQYQGDKVFREPQTPQELWAAAGAVWLHRLNPDGASRRNDCGFNKMDSEFGRDMATRISSGQGLTDKQWAALIRMLRKYHRQIGQCPE